jgi:hypothetical protein
VLVVDFVRTPNGQQIRVFRVPPNFDPLVNEKVVNNEINNSVDQYPNPNAQGNIPFKDGPKDKGSDRNDGEEYEKGIIELEKGIVFVSHMMILVKVPEYTMHNVLVHGPGNSFHKNSGNQNRDK